MRRWISILLLLTLLALVATNAEMVDKHHHTHQRHYRVSTHHTHQQVATDQNDQQETPKERFQFMQRRRRRRRKKKGIMSAIGKGLKSMVMSASSLKDERCALCQFIMERVLADLQISGGLNPYFGGAAPPPPQPLVSGEAEAQNEEAPAFIEMKMDVRYPDSKDPARRPRVYPLLTDEYEKSMTSQVYRVIDITTEQVCEVNMPVHYFYLVCKSIYAQQQKIAKLLVNQRNPIEICNEVAICGAGSYTFGAKHSKFGSSFNMMKPFMKSLGIA